MSDPILLIPYQPPPRYDSGTPVAVPIVVRFLRAGVVMALEWTTLDYIENAPRTAKVATFVVAIFLLAVLESRDWLNFKGPRHFALAITGLLVLYAAIVGYAYWSQPQQVVAAPPPSAAPHVISVPSPALATAPQIGGTTSPLHEQVLTPVQTGVPKSLPADLASIADLQTKLDAANAEVTRLKQINQSTPAGAKSSFLGLDDAKRWQITRALHDAIVEANGDMSCHLIAFGDKANDPSQIEFWREIEPILTVGGWYVEGGTTPKAMEPDGVTMNVGVDKGAAFNCAYRLSEILEQLGVHPVIRVNQTTPDLIRTENKGVEFVMGDMSGNGNSN